MKNFCVHTLSVKGEKMKQIQGH